MDEQTKKKVLEILNMIAEGLQEDTWRRLERGREKVKEDPDDKWIDYQQGVIHGMDEGTQRIFWFVEEIKNDRLM